MARYKIKQERPSRAREAAAEYKTAADLQPVQAPGVYHVTVTDRGRIVLPVEIRKRLKIRDGDRVAVAIEEDGTIEIETLDVAIRKMRGMFKHLAPRDHFASDDLIAERRRQARMEDREFRERTALHRRMGRR
jgi:AbrB family looped-hinge helix DNA binding protein